MSGTVGIVGYGSIGSRLVAKINEDPELTLAFVYDVDQKKLAGLNDTLLLGSLEEARARRTDLIVEVVSAEWVVDYAPVILEFGDLLIVSVAALAKAGLQEKLDTIANANKTHYFISHGAIIGLDGIRDGKEMIEDVRITTIRPQEGYGLNERISKRTVLYEGPTRKACERFPHNVNIHASLAIHGLGFDNTHSTVIADPEIRVMQHIIEVKGNGLAWRIEVEGKPLGARNAAYVPESVFSTIKRICATGYGMRLL